MTRRTANYRAKTFRLTVATVEQLEELAVRYGTQTTALTVAIDRLYQTEIREDDMTEREIRVRVEFSEDGLFGGWSDMDLWDVEASKAAYRDELETALEEAFPGADIDIVTGLDAVNDRMQVWVDGVEDQERRYAELAEAVGDVYQSFGWVRYTEAGIRVALPEGLWLERPQDGVIISVEEINCEEYEISFHKGELPAHESLRCTTIDEAMTVMQRTHTGDWSDWRPRTA